MIYVKSFAAWIVFAIVSAFTDWRLAMATGLVAAALTIVAQRRSGIDLLSWGTLGFFVVCTAIAFGFPHSGLKDQTAALSLATLGAVSAVSLAFRRPFTMTFAKRETPRELWDHPWFYRINATLTAAWTVSFLLTGLACFIAVLVAPSVTILWVPCQIIGFAAPAVFTQWYPDRAVARLTAQAQAQPQAQPQSI